MIRSALPLSAFLLVGVQVAQAQSPAVLPASPTQLDRIESKLDDVLRRLAQPAQQPQLAAQGQANPSAITALPSATGEALAASPGVYKPGAIAVAHPAPKDEKSLTEIPSDKVGGFIYQGGPIVLTDIATRGVRYAGAAGVELQGWFRAKEAGRYQFATDLTARFAYSIDPPACILQAWLEGRSLDQRSALVAGLGISKEASATLVLGADLQPGIYRLRVWTACTPLAGVSSTSELLIKAPSELNLRPVTGNDLLHREE